MGTQGCKHRGETITSTDLLIKVEFSSLLYQLGRNMMSRRLLSVFVLLSVLTRLLPAGAEESRVGTDEEGRQKRDVPNWAMTSSDFFGWVEELRKHAGYQHIEDLARTFWAHFPAADRLGYGTHEP